ncbi:hypothetical protein E2C01_097364 [Portunus trituberculatus]|uniref:Uncharacterized protein n=1 Tax=Portunus trituberculatus TaxID=210409 RepID=A0A5B7K9R7_PORTR|nr:hypothetical protein [Portunus trituberculatus]
MHGWKSKKKKRTMIKSRKNIFLFITLTTTTTTTTTTTIMTNGYTCMGGQQREQRLGNEHIRHHQYIA